MIDLEALKRYVERLDTVESWVRNSAEDSDPDVFNATCRGAISKLFNDTQAKADLDIIRRHIEGAP